jgi:multidrug efflux pump subunit AcrB
MQITPLFDQSVFVSDAIGDVIREAVIAAGLTGGMILMFLGSWRSTLIVLVSIPLSILTSLVALTALGETINIMTPRRPRARGRHSRRRRHRRDREYLSPDGGG